MRCGARGLGCGLLAIGLVIAPARSLAQDEDEAALDETALDAAFGETGEDSGIDEAALDAAFDFESLEGLELGDEFALLAQEDIVVSASRRAQRIDDSPSAITVLTHEDLLASPFDNIADVLRTVPGVDVMLLTIAFPALGTRSGTSIAGSNVLVLVDGRDVLNHLFQLPLWLGLPVDLESIERVEVIRGPASTLYGANAVQGVINIVTRRATRDPLQVEVDLRGASPANIAGDARIHGTAGAWSWWSAWGYELRAPYHDPTHVGASSFRSRSWLRHEGEAWEASVELGGGIQNGEIVTFAGFGSGRFAGGYLRADAIVHETRIRVFADQVDATMDLDANLRLPSDPDTILGELPVVSHPTRLYELDLERSWKLVDGLRLMTGLDAKLIHHRPGAMVTCEEAAGSEFDPTTCELSEFFELRYGGFTQLEWHALDDLDLNLGLRIGGNTLIAEPGIAPRAAAVYRLTSRQTLRFSIARSFRKPSFFELHGHVLMEPVSLAPDSELQRRIQGLFATGVGNADLVNTKVDIVELGWRGRFLEDRLRTEVELYASRFIGDVIVDDDALQNLRYFAGLPIIDDTVQITYRNDDRLTWSVGAELSATWQLAEGIELFGAYILDHVRRQVTTGSRETIKSRGEPEHRVNLSGRLRRGPMRVSLDALWVGAYSGAFPNPISTLATPVRSSLGANTLLAARVGYLFDFSGAELEAGIYGLSPVLGLELRETPGAYLDDGSNAYGHPIRPRFQAYLRSTF